MRKSVFLLLAFCVAMTSSAAPLRFSGELPISSTRHGEPTSAKWNPALATDGNGYLAVWFDSRAGVMATRVSATGNVLDPGGLSLGKGGRAAVAWTGRSYVVAWIEGADTIRATTVTGDGVIGASRVIGSGRGLPAVASTGSTVAITVSGTLTSAPMAFVLDLDLNKVAERRIVVRGHAHVYDLSIAALRGTYMLAALSNAVSVYTLLLSESGVLSNEMLVPNAFSTRDVAIAAGADDFLVLWDTASGLNAQRMSLANQPIGGTKVIDSTRQTDLRQPLDRNSVVWSDGEYLVANRSVGGEVRLTRLTATGDPAGAPSAPAGLMNDHDTIGLAAKSDGSGALFYIGRGAASRPLLVLFGSASSGTLSDPIPLARSATEQLMPAADDLGASSVVVWFERTVGSNEIRLSRAGREVVVEKPLVPPLWLDVVADEKMVWVLWVTGDSKKLHVRRFTQSLRPIDDDLLQFPMPNRLQWVEGADGGNGSVMIVSRADSDLQEIVGTVLRATKDDVEHEEVVIGAQQNEDLSPRVAWDGTQFVVVWRHITADGMDWLLRPEALQLARVSAEGELLDPAPVVLLAREVPSFEALRLVSSDGRLVVAWQDAGTTVAAFIEGTTLGEIRTLHNVASRDLYLISLVGLPDGSIDFYYEAFDPAGFALATYLHDRVSPDLTTTTAPIEIVDVGANRDHPGGFAATANRMSARIYYVRRAPEPEYGSVERIFTRTGGSSGRRRGVRP